MACGSRSSGCFEVKRQRTALEQLRLEVAALDRVAADDPATPPFAAEDVEPSNHGGARPTFDDLGTAGISAVQTPAYSRSTRSGSSAQVLCEHAGICLEAGISELATRSLELATELGLAEDEARRRASDCAAAKAEWSRALGQATAAEARAERRVAAAQQELEGLGSEEAQEETAFRLERERLRQRLRSLRMRVGQAERQCSAVRREEAFAAEFGEEAAARPPPAAAGRGRSASPHGERPAPARLRELRHDHGAAREGLLELQERRRELLRGREELRERERGLRRAARLSDREVAHIRRLEEFRSQEAALREESAGARAELRAVEAEAERERRAAAQLRAAQERAFTELGECDLRFRGERASELEALGAIDQYLGSGCAASGRRRQEHLAEWVEADVGARQVEYMKQRLSEIVADAGAHAQVLEQAVAELHADLDRRAAVVLELAERRSALLNTDLGETDANSASEPNEDRLISTVYDGSSDVSGNLEETPTLASDPWTIPMPQHTGRRSRSVEGEGPSRRPACHNGEDSRLELRALEAELQHQRDLFQLRSTQVQGLEQRLALLLAQEAPRVHAIRTWIAVHEPLTRQRLDACMAAVASESSRETTLRADVAAMREDKSTYLSEAESKWRAERQQLWEASSAARCGADEAAARAAALQRRREGLLQGLDRLLGAERRLASRAGGARELVERDRRQLVDVAVRQLRASSAADRPLQGARAEAAREALVGAHEIVEAARSQQVETLGSIQTEASAVSIELKQVSEAVEHASAMEEHVFNELAEAEAEAEADSAWAHQDDSQGALRRPQMALDSIHPRARSQLRPGAAPPAAAPRRAPCLRLAEQRRAARERELEAAAERLRGLERQRAEGGERQKAGGRALRARLEERAEALEAERARQRAASGAVLRRLRGAEASARGAEQRCADLRERREALGAEVAETRAALQGARGQRQGRARSEAPRFSGARSSDEPGGPRQGAEGRGRAGPGEAERQAAMARSSSEASSGSTSAPSGVPRSLPSIAEVRQRVSGHPELCTFYLQVSPLLRGAPVELFRRPLQRFEPRQLVLSSDLQRLEVWPPAEGAQRGRRRVSESFLRIEGLTRLHIPKATLAAVQQTIMGTVDASEAPWGPGPPPPEPREPSPRPAPGCFPFDLMLSGAEPWRLLAADVRAFHAVTAALGALLAARASLPSFALALGLGAASAAVPAH